MELSNLFFYGITGYILLVLYDLSQLRASAWLRIPLSLGFPLTALPYLLLLSRYRLPIADSTLRSLFYMVCLLFGILLTYSAVFEIPLYQLRHTADGTKEPEVYSRGTYRHSRHPGFIWYTCINILFILAYQKMEITILMSILTLCNFALIVLEDVFIFPRTLAGYDRYKQHVPFLLRLPRGS